MPIVTTRPSTVGAVQGGWTRVGSAAPAATILADNDPTTYLEARTASPMTPAQMLMVDGAVPEPGTARRVRRVKVRAQVGEPRDPSYFGPRLGGVTWGLYEQLFGSRVDIADGVWFWLGAEFAERSGQWVTPPAKVQTQQTTLGVELAGGNWGAAAELFLDYDVRERPVVLQPNVRQTQGGANVTTVTGTQRPWITVISGWEVSPDLNDRAAVEVRISTVDHADPAAVWDTNVGLVTSFTVQGLGAPGAPLDVFERRVDDALPNGQLHVYARVSAPWPGGAWYSTTTKRTFTQQFSNPIPAILVRSPRADRLGWTMQVQNGGGTGGADWDSPPNVVLQRRYRLPGEEWSDWIELTDNPLLPVGFRIFVAEVGLPFSDPADRCEDEPEAVDVQFRATLRGTVSGDPVQTIWANMPLSGDLHTLEPPDDCSVFAVNPWSLHTSVEFAEGVLSDLSWDRPRRVTKHQFGEGGLPAVFGILPEGRSFEVTMLVRRLEVKRWERLLNRVSVLVHTPDDGSWWATLTGLSVVRDKLGWRRVTVTGVQSGEPTQPRPYIIEALP